jgi:septum formation protein
LAAAGYEFSVAAAEVDETPRAGEPPLNQVQRLAAAKATSVANLHPFSLVLAADTIVVLNGTIYGKPRDLGTAKEILKNLSGQTHEVATAFCLYEGPNSQRHIETCVSKVAFRPLSEMEIDLYLTKGESLDKAGAYAVQGQGLGLIQEVQGSLTNVMGLPLTEVLAALLKVLSSSN